MERKKDEPYQATSERLWNSSVIRGIAVAIIVCGMNHVSRSEHHIGKGVLKRILTKSKDVRNMAKIKATMVKIRWKPVGYSPSSSSDSVLNGCSTSGPLVLCGSSPVFVFSLSVSPVEPRAGTASSISLPAMPSSSKVREGLQEWVDKLEADNGCNRQGFLP